MNASKKSMSMLLSWHPAYRVHQDCSTLLEATRWTAVQELYLTVVQKILYSQQKPYIVNSVSISRILIQPSFSSFHHEVTDDQMPAV